MNDHSATGEPRRLSHAKVRHASSVPALLVLLLGLGLLAASRCNLRINLTPSEPLGFYLVSPQPLTRGILVEVCPPSGLAALSYRRGYLPRGTCPSGVRPVLKSVLALPGDRVAVTRIGLFLDAQPVSLSRPVARDRRGRPLPAFPPGIQQVPQGALWLHARQVNSWDSRYFGALPLQGVRNVLLPLWVLP